MSDDDRSADDMATKFAPNVDRGTVADFDEAKRSRVAKDGADTRRAFYFVPRALLKAKPTNWLVKRLLEADCVAVLIGEPETFKSFMALGIAMCVASNTPWHGRNVKGGPVLYIAGEGQTGLAKRITAWERHHGIDLAYHPIMFSTMPTALTDERAKAVLLAEIDKAAAYFGTMPVLVVIDTLSRNFGPGDENATVDMQRAGMTLDAIRNATQGGTVMVVHHSGHTDKTRGRGSSVLWGNSDAEYLLTKDENAGTVTMAARKMKDGPKPAPMAFMPTVVNIDVFDEDGEPETSVVLVPTDYVPPTRTNAGTGKNQTIALNILRDMYARNRANVAASGRDPDMARVTVEDWRALCATDGIDRRRFWEASRSLSLTGLVCITNGFVALSETSETHPKRYVSDGPEASETSEPPYRGSDVRTFGHPDPASETGGQPTRTPSDGNGAIQCGAP